MTKFKLRKVSKINLRIISKPHAHLQSMVKTSVKFQKNRKVAHTRYPDARKMTKCKFRKMSKKLIRGLYPKTCTSLQSMMKTSVKFHKNHCKRSCAHKVQTPLGGERTDIRKDGWTERRKDVKPKTMSLRFLAHLSRRLTGELKTYTHAPASVRRLSFTISKIFSSETAWPIKAKLHVEHP